MVGQSEDTKHRHPHSKGGTIEEKKKSAIPRNFKILSDNFNKIDLVLLNLELFQAMCHCPYFQYNKWCEWGGQERGGRQYVHTCEKIVFSPLNVCYAFMSGINYSNKQKNMPKGRNHKISESWNHHWKPLAMEPVPQQKCHCCSCWTYAGKTPETELTTSLEAHSHLRPCSRLLTIFLCFETKSSPLQLSLLQKVGLES